MKQLTNYTNVTYIRLTIYNEFDLEDADKEIQNCTIWCQSFITSPIKLLPKWTGSMHNQSLMVDANANLLHVTLNVNGY